jgi:hypothetical protein
MGAPGTQHAKTIDDVAARFWPKVKKTQTCWLWTGTTSKGYGVLKMLGRRDVKAHRMSWFLKYGKWPEQSIDHLCGVRICVNPEHLEDVSPSTNSTRSNALQPRKSKCKHGHPFIGRNLYMWGTRQYCMACDYVRKGYEPTWDVATGR